MKRVFKYFCNVLLWLVVSLPVVTLGASTTAMHFVNFKLVKDDGISVPKEFFKSFKQNFGQSIVLLVICGVTGTMIGWCWARQLKDFANASMAVIAILIVATLVFFGFESLSTYLLSKFDNKTPRLLMLTVYSMIRHCDIAVKVTIVEAVTVAVPAAVIAVNPAPLTISIGAVIFLVLLVIHEITSSRWITGIFDILLKTQEEAAARAAAETSSDSVSEDGTKDEISGNMPEADEAKEE